MRLQAAWDMNDSFHTEQAEQARRRLAKKSEARQKALMARRESRELATNTNSSSSTNTNYAALQPTNSHNRRRGSWSSKNLNKSASPFRPGSAGSRLKCNSNHSSNINNGNSWEAFLRDEENDSPAYSKSNRRKSWTKSGVVTRVEEMKRRREKRRMSNQIELEARKAELQEYGQWGMFAKLLKETRQDIATSSKPEDFVGHDKALGDCPITVCVRKRPLNDDESTNSSLDVVTRSKIHEATVHEPVTRVDGTPDIKNSRFNFDHVFHEEDDSERVYDCILHEKLTHVLTGGNLTCFAYGQTGSGKTFTMTAITSMVMDNLFAAGVPGDDEEPLIGTTLFARLSFYEIYMGKVFDLLNNRQQLRVLEDSKLNVTIQGLKEIQISGIDGVKRLLNKGHKSRSVGVTSANADSSRSHAVVTVRLYDTPASKRHNHRRKLCGQINLVDLAGSERAADTLNCDALRAREGGDINKSLLALKECIRAMGSNSQHTPFRGSKLTQVLRQALTAHHSRTVMIATVSPSIENCEHTLNTLRYAQRLKEVGEQRHYAALHSGKKVSAETMSQPSNLEATQQCGANNSMNVHTVAKTSTASISHKSITESAICQGDKVMITKGKYNSQIGEIVSTTKRTARILLSSGKVTGNISLSDLVKSTDNAVKSTLSGPEPAWVSGETAQFSPKMGRDRGSGNSDFDSRDTLLSTTAAKISAIAKGGISHSTDMHQEVAKKSKAGQKLLLHAFSRESSPARPQKKKGTAPEEKSIPTALKESAKQKNKSLSTPTSTIIDKNGQMQELTRLRAVEKEQKAELRRLRNLLSKPSARETRMSQEVKQLRKQLAEATKNSNRKSASEDSNEAVAKLGAAEKQIKALESKVLKLEAALKKAQQNDAQQAKSISTETSNLRKENKKLSKALRQSKEGRDDQQLLIMGLKAKRQSVSQAVKNTSKAFKKLSDVSKLLKTDTAKSMKTFNSFVHQSMQNLLEKMATGHGCLQAMQEAYQKEFRLRKKIFNQLQELRGNIRVFVRVRPLLKNEISQGHKAAVHCRGEDSVALRPHSLGVTKHGKPRIAPESVWELDHVFVPGVSNEQVYSEVEPLVTSVLDGYNVCIFAYGQTGAGKTHTMDGSINDPGINPRALQTLFSMRKQRMSQFDITVRCSMLEIYNETIHDLLDPSNPRKLSVKIGPRGNHVPGLSTQEVTSAEELAAIFQKGSHNRSIASTKMNDRSSRSHCMLSVVVESKSRLNGQVLVGRLHNIDLAGSERLAKSKAEGQRAKEAAAINKSLSALGNVIAALANKQGHVPFRDSVLTHALQSSLGGNSKILMFANIGSAEYNTDESTATLNFASRARKVAVGKAERHSYDRGDQHD